MTATVGPLSDVRVLDFTHALAGPYCTMLLTDLGADVVKVEPPSGDLARRVGPFPSSAADAPYGGYFQSVNRGKRSVVANLKAPEERDRILALVPDFDVVVENFTPGVMERLGLGWDALSARNPAVVYATIRGFGDPAFGRSPYAHWPTFDLVAQAMGGLMSITGAEPDKPLKAGPGVGDIFPATLAAVGLLAALHHARRTGAGQHVDVAMYDGIVALCERIVHQHSYTGEVPTQQGNTHPLLSPFDIFRSSDGFVAIAAPRDAQWERLLGLIARPELLSDERFASVRSRAEHGHAVREVISTWAAQRTNAEIIECLGGRIPVGPVNDVGDIFADPHTRIREMLIEVEQPGHGTVVVAGSPIKLSQTPSKVRSRAPLLGEHTQEVLFP
jgi:crotonobetainyl-CoA:carnitine CoA-transferase CaiB-like acyl-CoA transferase